jgi:polyisoprenoid-binding protein YceI
MKAITTSLLAASALALAAAPLLAADVYTIDTVHSNVNFKVRHLISKTPGQFTDFDGSLVIDWQDPAKSKVEFVIQAASIDTRNPDRDKHLRSADFFDVEKYPTITFAATGFEKVGENSYRVTGDFTMHGVTRTVTLPVTYLGEMVGPRGKVVAGFELETTLDRKDYGIVWNRALDTGGLVLGDEVEVEIHLEVAKQS